MVAYQNYMIFFTHLRKTKSVINLCASNPWKVSSHSQKPCKVMAKRSEKYTQRHRKVWKLGVLVDSIGQNVGRGDIRIFWKLRGTAFAGPFFLVKSGINLQKSGRLRPTCPPGSLNHWTFKVDLMTKVGGAIETEQ